MLDGASGAFKDNWVGYVDTMYAYHLPGVDASSLTDYRWAEMFKQLQEIRKEESKQWPT